MKYTAQRIQEKTDYWCTKTMRWQCKTLVFYIVESEGVFKKLMTSKEFYSFKKRGY